MSRPSALLVLVGCVLVSAPPARADDAEDKAVAFVVKLGGSVTRDEKKPGKPVVAVNLSETKVTDAGLKELAALQSLTKLTLRETEVTGAGVKELAALRNLTKLYLTDSKVTNAGLRDLAALQGLQHLDLTGTKVTDAGLEHLAALKSLTRLDLFLTEVTDAGVKELQKALPNCKIEKGSGPRAAVPARPRLR